MPDGGLPPQRRSRSLARLEEEIARAETACRRWMAQAEALEAAGRDGRQVRGLLSVAEERLGQLNRSREVLLRGEESEGRARLTRRRAAPREAARAVRIVANPPRCARGRRPARRRAKREGRPRETARMGSSDEPPG